MRNFIYYLIIFIILFPTSKAFTQDCADEANIVSFTFNDIYYEIVKENKTWVDAAACAVERGGFLVIIDSEDEQNAIYNNLLLADINVDNTVAPDGGNASYVWLGGNDIAEEGVWIWDGNNDGEGEQFWQGDASGGPVNELYSNWGTEPDNWNNQDAVGIALTEWPLGSGVLGQPSQWNDVDHENELFFIIEYFPTTIEENDRMGIKIYPNPADKQISISSENEILAYDILNMSGQIIISTNQVDDFSGNIDIQEINEGSYFLKVTFGNGFVAKRHFIVSR